MAGRLLPGVVHNLSGAVQLVRLPLDLMEMKLQRADKSELAAKLASAQEGVNRLNNQLELLGGRAGHDLDLEPKVSTFANWPGSSWPFGRRTCFSSTT